MLDEKQIDPLIYRRLLSLEEKYDALLAEYNKLLMFQKNDIKRLMDWAQAMEPELGKLQNNHATLEKIVSDLLDAHVERENNQAMALRAAFGVANSGAFPGGVNAAAPTGVPHRGVLEPGTWPTVAAESAGSIPEPDRDPHSAPDPKPSNDDGNTEPTEPPKTA